MYPNVIFINAISLFVHIDIISVENKYYIFNFYVAPECILIVMNIANFMLSELINC